MLLHAQERFGQDILTRLEAGPVEQTVRSDTGKVITYSLTKEVGRERFRHPNCRPAAPATSLPCTTQAAQPGPTRRSSAGANPSHSPTPSLPLRP